MTKKKPNPLVEYLDTLDQTMLLADEYKALAEDMGRNAFAMLFDRVGQNCRSAVFNLELHADADVLPTLRKDAETDHTYVLDLGALLATLEPLVDENDDDDDDDDGEVE